MKPVRIYTTNWCGYCHRAKKILEREGVAFREIDVTDDDTAREWLVRTTGRRTVPQIFFGDESIGGCDDLEVLVRRGSLHERLAVPA